MRRGAPPLSRSGDDDGVVELLYLDCPACWSAIKQPFNPDGGPLVWSHPCSRRRSARLIVLPKERRVYEVPENVSLEAELRRAIGRAS